MEGGFNTNDKQVEYEEVNNIVILPNFKEIQLNLPNLPDKVCLPFNLIHTDTCFS